MIFAGMLRFDINVGAEVADARRSLCTGDEPSLAKKVAARHDEWLFLLYRTPRHEQKPVQLQPNLYISIPYISITSL